MRNVYTEGSCEAYCMSMTMPDDPLTVSLIMTVPNIAGSFLASRACMHNDQTRYNVESAVLRDEQLVLLALTQKPCLWRPVTGLQAAGPQSHLIEALQDTIQCICCYLLIHRS